MSYPTILVIPQHASLTTKQEREADAIIEVAHNQQYFSVVKNRFVTPAIEYPRPINELYVTLMLFSMVEAKRTPDTKEKSNTVAAGI